MSFRDPAGRLIVRKGRYFRVVDPHRAAAVRTFLTSDLGRGHMEAGRLVRTEILSTAPAEEHGQPTTLEPEGALWLEHEPVLFPSFPYEWAPEMLHSAALLTLELAKLSLAAGIGLKDATPFNVLFRHARPVFVDVLSFEERAPGDALWGAYAQFARTFLLPLAVSRSLGMRLDRVFLCGRDGLAPEEVADWLGSLRSLRAPFLSLVTLPRLLSGSAEKRGTGLYERRNDTDPERARFVLDSLFARLRRAVDKQLAAGRRGSDWCGYRDTIPCDQAARKAELVEEALRICGSREVLDVGCNTGQFSEIAARQGAHVVALDSDPVVVGRLFRMASAQDLPVLPLVIDFARPSPATGWRNGECASFLERARGHFDLVMMLAVVHHLLVTERVPLDQILDLVAELTRDAALIEYVDSTDPQFIRLLRGRADLHAGFDTSVFEQACRRRFEIAASWPSGTTRTLYLLKRKHVGA